MEPGRTIKVRRATIYGVDRPLRLDYRAPLATAPLMRFMSDRAIPGVEAFDGVTFRDPDAYPASDLGVREGFRALGLPTAASAIADHAERWRPWRGYAVMHLWNG